MPVLLFIASLIYNIVLHNNAKHELYWPVSKEVAGTSTSVTQNPNPTIIIPTPTFIPSPTATPTPTLTPTPTIIINAPADLEDLFTKYANAYGVDKQYLERIANCESHFGTGANNGPYGGMFQFAKEIWISTRGLMGIDPNPDLRFSAEESIRTAAFLISQNHSSLWPNCGK